MNPLDQIYQVNGVPITVRHFERVAKQMPGYSSLPLHGKMPALKELIEWQSNNGVKKIGCFASHGSNWVQGVPIIARGYDIETTIVYATSLERPKYPDFIKAAKEQGAKIVPIRPNMTAINSSQAKNLIEQWGGYFIPFGLETRPVLDYLTEAMDFDDGLATLVLCAGSGITLAGILLHLKKYNKRIKCIYAVSSGRPLDSILDTVRRHIPASEYLGPFAGDLILLGGYTYQDKRMAKVVSPWETHEYYERKAYAYISEPLVTKTLREPIVFLNMGI